MRLLLRRLILAALACFALFGVGAGGVVLWAWINRSDFSPQDRVIIEKELGWKVPKGGHNELVQMVVRNPLPVIQLLTHDSQRVRLWAKELLFRQEGADNLSVELLDLVSAELDESSSAYNKSDLIGLLANAGERGIERLMLLYRSQRPIEPGLHLTICAQVGKARSRDELIHALLEAVKNDTTILENRCRAAEALGSMRRPEPTAGAKPPEAAAITKLTELLPHLPESVATAVRAALATINRRDEAQRDYVEPRYPGDGHVTPPDQDGGADALAALKDKTDWVRTGYAAELLTRHGITAAIPDLQQIADTHWYEPVRKVARQAVHILQGAEPALPDRHSSIMWSLVMSYERDAFVAWSKTHAASSPVLDGIEGMLGSAAHEVEPVRDAVFAWLQPKFERVQFERPGRLPVIEDSEDFSMKPKQAISFAGGKLLGYDQGEFGSGTVFYRHGEIAQYLSTDNVQHFVRIEAGVLVFCDTAMIRDRRVYLATQQPDGKVSVAFLVRLPTFHGEPTLLRSGDVLVPCVLGDIFILKNGELRAADPVK